MSQDSSQAKNSSAAFWSLVAKSRLLTRDQCQQLSARLKQNAAVDTADPKQIAQWLVTQNVLSRYQATILLGGRAGPFLYGDYKVYDRIEKGRLANWFRAVHSTTNHPILLKFLTGQVAQDARLWSQLVASTPAIHHANLARWYEAVDLGAYKFLVVEDLRGKSLAEALAASPRLKPAQACYVARQAASGLAALHHAGRPHGDVRPKNLWLATTGVTKLLVDPDLDLRQPDLANSDPAAEMIARSDYLAPEFMQPGKRPDPLTDIYALGCALYEMIAGRPPFPGGAIANKLQRHATEAIQPLESFGAPAELGKVVAFMMAKNPSVRFQQASILVDQLAPFVDPKRLGVSAPPSTATQAAFERTLLARQPSSGAPGAAPQLETSHRSPGSIAPIAPIAVQAPRAPRPSRSTRSARSARPVASAVRTAPVPAGRAEGGPPIKISDKPVVANQRGPTSTGARTVASVAARQARQRAQQRKMMVLAASLLAIVAAASVVAAVALNRPSNEPTPRAPVNAELTPGGKPQGRRQADLPPQLPGGDLGRAPSTAPDPVRSDEPDLVVDNGDVLWASPTRGEPISLDFLPGGAQSLLIARPAEIAALEEGGRVLRALGPDFETLQAEWETASGFPFDQIAQIVVGLYPAGGQLPHIACVVRPSRPVGSRELLTAWGNPSPQEAGGNTYYQGASWAYYVPDDSGAVFVMGHPTEIRDLAESNAAPPLLRREIGQLLRASDAERHVTLLFAPNFLFAEGRPLFAGERAKGLDALSWFLSDSLKAGMVSLHFDPQLYVEMRMESDIATDHHALASQVRDRMREIPPAIETYLANLNPHPYWRIVANRFPQMVGFLHDQTRIGVEGNHAVLNAVLPQNAAHNLVFGSEMVLASAPGAGAVAAPATVSGPQTIEDVLNAKISLNFAQDSLEFSMQNVVNEVTSTYKLPFEFKIKILGDDLKLDGITRNQQVRDFRQDDKSVAEVLTALVMKANPVTTVKEPHEKDQKLLWVVAPDPEEASNRIVLITTRQVAEQKYTLPEVFREK